MPNADLWDIGYMPNADLWNIGYMPNADLWDIGYMPNADLWGIGYVPNAPNAREGSDMHWSHPLRLGPPHCSDFPAHPTTSGAATDAA